MRGVNQITANRMVSRDHFQRKKTPLAGHLASDNPGAVLISIFQIGAVPISIFQKIKSLIVRR